MRNCSVRRKAKIFLSEQADTATLSRFRSLYRTFIVADDSEEEFGHCATDELTGEQGHVDDENFCFWTRDDSRSTWKTRPFRSRQLKRTKEKGKGDAYPQTGFSASATSCEDEQGPPRGPSDRCSNCSDDSSTSAWYNSSLDGVSSLGSCPPFDARCS